MKKGLFIFLMALTGLVACKKENNNTLPKRPPLDKNYTFSGGVMPRNVLESYLSRAISLTEFVNSDGFYSDGPYLDKEDDKRMLKNMGAKFISRAMYSWGVEDRFNNPAFFNNAKTLMAEMHQFDSDIIFQGGIFEIVTPAVNNIPVPAWVFEEYGMAPATRNFVYNDMINLQGNGVGQWGAGSVPDISRTETQMFFFFLARQFMQAGIEALHFGQVELMSMVDRNNNFSGWNNLLTRIRNAAKTVARRGTVICDGHMGSGGVVVDGKLIFDFVGFPLRIKEIGGEPQKGELKKIFLDAIYGSTNGGVTPSGWSCEQVPYLVEFDNYGISDHPGVASVTDHWVWGYDEITWFYHQPESEKNDFLAYAHKWINKIDHIGYLSMPGSRVVSLGGGQITRYRANTNSATSTQGQNQEETIKKLWNNEQLN